MEDLPGNKKLVYRRGLETGVYKKTINEQYGFTFSLQLDPIIVKSKSIKIPACPVHLFLQRKQCGTMMCLAFC